MRHDQPEFSGPIGPTELPKSPPPHQCVIARRIERVRPLLRAGADLSFAAVAARAGFSDQSQLSRHFTRLAGATPGQYRTPARIA
jgi:transcriptional regulator GlxA family with amidase domain